tara:strand:+ start:670 stop:1803 length:1134 start_codon:yes stop_codon:yes gene_type:complete
MPEEIPLSLYVHIPWCQKKCPYCDFNSHAITTDIPEARYVESLIEDLKWDEKLSQGRKINTIFFGGGTPSIFSSNSIDQIITATDKLIGISPNAEITIEANPGSTDTIKYDDFFSIGINRVSIGVQSFQSEHLKSLGRIHSNKDAKDAILAATKAGFNNINIDLMHGLQNQNIREAKEDLKFAIDAGANHISWYQLTIEPNTEFYSKPPILPNTDELADIYDNGMTLLRKKGFEQYEVSAFTSNKKPSLHNLNYWSFGDYIGVGAGAHGKITTKKRGIVRTLKSKMPNSYMERRDKNTGIRKSITQDELITEFMMNALRLKNGVPWTYFESRTGISQSAISERVIDLQNQGLLEFCMEQLRTSDLGYRFVNSILEKF